MLWADQQRSGRGTHDRKWVSPPGGLYYSLAFPADLVSGSDPIVLLGGAYVWQRYLSDKYSDTPGEFSLKWPNDLLHDGRKLGGFLANKRSDMFYIGVGLNVNNDMDDSRDDLRQPAVSLSEITGLDHSPRDLLLGWVDRFYDRVTETDGAPFPADQLADSLSTIGQTVKTDQGEGEAVGLGENGELEVELDGEIITKHSPDNVEVQPRETRR